MDRQTKFRALRVVGAAFAALLITLPTVDAAPKWRLRRWLTHRPPIDSTIRPTVSFQRRIAQPTYRQPTPVGYRVNRR